MADFKNYDPGQIVISFGSVRLTGFMDGTFVVAERTEDAFETHVGAGGDVTRVRNRDTSGTVTVTLKAESPANALLSAIARLDEKFGTGVNPIRVENLNGTHIAEAANAWIQKRPNAEWADTASGREWVFGCADLAMINGSNTV